MEIFKEVKGYEGLYQVSNRGTIKSLPRGSRKGIKILRQEIVKRNTTNYRRVSLCKDGIVKRFQVHRLVAEMFIANPENKPFVNHIDNSGENNSVENLEWCTHSENMIHAEKQGRLHLTQSRAGKARGILATEEKHARQRALIGKTIGQRTIIRFLESDAKHPRAEVRCNCCKALFGTSDLKRTGPCRSCALKNAHKMKI